MEMLNLWAIYINLILSMLGLWYTLYLGVRTFIVTRGKIFLAMVPILIWFIVIDWIQAEVLIFNLPVASGIRHVMTLVGSILILCILFSKKIRREVNAFEQIMKYQEEEK